MGGSSSLLDENKSNYIKGLVDDLFKEFGLIYKKQYFLAYLSKIQDEIEQRKELHTQFLKQRAPLEPGKVLYEELVQCFEDNRRWKARFLVMRACHNLEFHESYKMFIKGAPPLHRMMPTGGTILTTEEKYMEMIDQCCPCTNNVKDDFAPPVSGMPGEFPVYLRLPYRQDSYFCFRNENAQDEFISILSDSIRHQNKDFLKKKTCEVKAFLKAIQFYRQKKGQYESWDMLIGSEVRGLANLLMEDLMPYLEKELQPYMQSKRTEKRRVWFVTVEAAYILLQEQILERLNSLKDECKDMVKQKEALMRSNMDQIISSRAFLEGKIRAMVTEPATKYCTEQVQPHLPAILEEVMGPISLGFTEARKLSEAMMEQLCQDFQDTDQKEDLLEALSKMSKANLQSCYEKVSGLADHVQELQQAFNYSIKGLKDSIEIDLKQLMDNVEYTFELLVRKALTDPSVSLLKAMEKASNRVLKQFDYDSSTVRKKIFQEALINITLPGIKKHLAPSFKEELPKFEQYIFADYSDLISVENVYEDIIHQMLEKDASLVVKEAANMKKYNLLTESKYNFSVSSLSFTPPGSEPSSPARLKTPPGRQTAMPPSPLLSNGLTANKSVTVHSESSPLSQALPVMDKIDEAEHKMPLEENSENVFVTATITSAETELITTTVAMEPSFSATPVAIITKEPSLDSNPVSTVTMEPSLSCTPVATIAQLEPSLSSAPVVMVTEGRENAGTCSPPIGGDGNCSYFPNKPTVAISPICMTTSGSCGDPEENDDNSKEVIKTEDSSDDLAQIKAQIRDEITHPIAVCLSIKDAEAGEVYKEFTGKQIMDLPEPPLEFQSSAQLQDESRPLDCVKEIRDLVVEVIEIEEMIQPFKDNEEVQMLIEPEAIV